MTNKWFLRLDVIDVDKHYPGLLKATIEWFKIYKIPDGKPENQFAFNGEAKPKEFALRVVEEVHKHWENLIKKKTNAGSISWLVKFVCNYHSLGETTNDIHVMDFDASLEIDFWIQKIKNYHT